MTVPQANLTIYQGSLFTVTIPGGGASWGVRMQLRSAPADQNGIVSVTLTTSGGGIVWNGTSHTVTITPAQSNAMTLLGGVWDCYGDPDGVPDNASVILEFGTWSMRPFVTASNASVAGVRGILVNGQSLSVGTHGVPVLSTTQPSHNVQLHDSSGNYTDPASGTWSLIPLIAPERADKFLNLQASNPYPINIDGETADITMANALSVLFPSPASWCPSNAGQGSASYTVVLWNGTGNAVSSLLAEATIASALAPGYIASFATLTHGETDYAVAPYGSIILAYQSQLQATARAITKQADAVAMVYNQMNSFPFGGTTTSPAVLVVAAGLGQLRAANRGVSVIKTTPSVGFTFDAGATSVATITGNGYAETTVDTVLDAGLARMFGLTHSFTGVQPEQQDYCLDVVGTAVEIFEGGVFKGNPATAKDGDVFRIVVTGTVVTYTQNGTVIYTSATAPTFPLHVQTGTYAQYVGLYNLNISGTPIAQWMNITGAVVADSSKMLLSGPDYYLPFYTDQIHLTAAGYQLLGEQYARAAAKYLNSGSWSPLRIVSAVRVGNSVTLTFNAPVAPLVWDTVQTSPHLSGTYAAWATGKGFEAWSGGYGGSIVTINSVTIQNGNQVVIACATTPDTIAYACTSDSVSLVLGTGGFPNGRCGLLHDSDPFVGPITGVAQPNWCLAFVVGV